MRKKVFVYFGFFVLMLIFFLGMVSAFGGFFSGFFEKLGFTSHAIIEFDNGLVVDHNSVAHFNEIPVEWIEQAKDDLHIVYQHTSHGSQLVTGMNAMESFPDYNGLYSWSDYGGEGLDFDDYGISGCADLSQGDSIDSNGVTPWVTATRNLLDNPSNNHVNVVMWSWCSINGHNIERYLDNMEILISEYGVGGTNARAEQYPVNFIFMTGHAEGQGEDGFIYSANEQIREHCRVNNRILYDFADIESYDSEGNYYYDLPMWDNLDYTGSSYRNSNWAQEWIGANQGSELEQLTTGNGVAGFDGTNGCAHSSSPLEANLNCALKGRGAWYLFARLAGWSPEGNEVGGNDGPVINSISGIISNDEEIVVSGNGFGVKEQAAPFRSSYDNPISSMNFQESGSIDEDYWTEVGDIMVSLQNNIQRTSNKDYVRLEYSSNASGSGYSAGVQSDFPQTRDSYVSWWDYFEPGFDFSHMETGGNNIKSIYLGVGSQPHAAYQIGGNNTYLFSSVRDGLLEPCSDKVTSDYPYHFYTSCFSWRVDYSYPIGEWFFNEILIHMSSDESTADGWREYRVNNRKIYKVVDGQFFEQSQDNDPFYSVMRFGGNYGYDDSGTTQYRYYGDLYLDGTLARVVLGNAENYDDCTHLELQVPNSWTDESINFTFNQGSFTDEEDVYLFVIDSNGEVSDGYQISFEPICGASVGNSCYYVSPSGDDANSGSFDSPYATIDYAINQLGSGDVLYLREGLYNVPSSTSSSCGDSIVIFDHKIYSTPITMMAYPNEQVIIEGNMADRGICIEQSEGIVIRDLEIRKSNSKLIRITNSKDIRIIHNHIHTVDGVLADNPSGIELAYESTKNIELAYNVIHNITGVDGGSSNAAGIMIFESNDLDIHNNYIYDSHSGIRYKHHSLPKTYTNVSVYNNRIHTMSSFGIGTGTSKANFFNNVIYDSDIGINLDNADDGPWEENNIFHNTIYDVAIGVSSPISTASEVSNDLIYGNIIFADIPYDFPELDDASGYSNCFGSNVFVIGGVNRNLFWLQENNLDVDSLVVPGEDLIQEEFIPSSNCKNLVVDEVLVGADLSKVESEIIFNISNFCGDGYCDVGENGSSCFVDCGSSITPPDIEEEIPIETVICGDGNCEGEENHESCPDDCILDEQAPTYTFSMSRPVVYSSTQPTSIIIDWDDNVGVTQTFIENNFSGNLVSTAGSSISRILNAGNYQWRGHGSDLAGNWNFTPVYRFTIDKANPSLSLNLNGQSHDVIIHKESSVNIQTSSNSEFVLYENGVEISPGIRFYSVPGIYNITLVVNENQNYLSSTLTRFINVTNEVSPIGVDFDESNWDDGTTHFENFSNEDLADIPNATFVHSRGKIRFLERLNIFRNLTLDNNVQISQNRIFINSTVIPELNKSAELILYNLSFVNPVVMKNGVLCSSPACEIISYVAGELIFRVEGFSEYVLDEMPTCSDWIQNQGELGIDCGGPCADCTEGQESDSSSSSSSGGSSSSYVPVEENIVDSTSENNVVCIANFKCGDWKECEFGLKERVCNDLNNCLGDKIESISCELEFEVVEDESFLDMEKLSTVLLLIGGVFSIFFIWFLIRLRDKFFRYRIRSFFFGV